MQLNLAQGYDVLNSQRLKLSDVAGRYAEHGLQPGSAKTGVS